MVFDSEAIKGYSYEELVNEHYNDHASWVAYYREREIESAKEYEIKLRDFRNKYPFLYIKPDLMSRDERRTLCIAACNNELTMAAFGGANKAELKEIEKKYSKPEIVDDFVLETAQSMLLFKEPKNYLTGRVEELEEKKDIFCLKMSRVDLSDDKFMEKIEDLASKLLKDGRQVRLAVNDAMASKSNEGLADYLYTPEDMEKLITLNNKLVLQGMEKGIVFDEFRFIRSVDDYNEAWNIDDVVKANKNVDNLAANIKKMNLSPFETMMFIHSYLTKNFAYAEGRTEECRVMPGIIKSGKIVCSGYASFVKTIVDKLNMPTLKCDLVGCELYKKSLTYDMEGGHCHNLIKIYDEKYGIDGYYIEDACWDAKIKNFEKGRGFSHCLYPISDLEHIKDMYYVQKDGASRLEALMFNPKDLQNAIVEMGKVFSGGKGKSRFTEYRERRAKVKSGSDIVRKYSHLSPAIPKVSYTKALTALHERVYGTISKESEAKIERDMFNSSLFGSLGFEKGAASEFTTDRNIAKEYMVQRNSLKSNDGRSE